MHPLILGILISGNLFGQINNEIVKGNNQFAFELLNKFSSIEKDINTVYSPLSISIAMAMTNCGAVGETQKQISEKLHFPNQLTFNKDYANLLDTLLTDKKDEKFLIANAIFIQENFNMLKSFKKSVSLYKPKIESFDFNEENNRNKAANSINTWVDKNTDHLISNIIEANELTGTKLLLINTTYFLGKWQHEFDKKLTKTKTFYSYNSQKTISFMNKTYDLRYQENDELKIVEIPYKDSILSMLIILPKVNDGLRFIENKIDINYYNNLIDTMYKIKVDLSIPKFKIEKEYLLKNYFISMGMTDPFDENANFAGIDGNPKCLYIDNIIHNSVIELSEDKTVASSTTVVKMKWRSISIGSVYHTTFIADHPFMFIIRNIRTGCILFIGKYVGI